MKNFFNFPALADTFIKMVANDLGKAIGKAIGCLACAEVNLDSNLAEFVLDTKGLIGNDGFNGFYGVLC